jgi:translation elongation factor EF-4
MLIRLVHSTDGTEEVVPRQLFELAIQAAVGSKVVARETLPANRKDVTAGLYGGEAHCCP